jgi:enoyl-[acyl-carrier-protein] reductase (NADH)
MFLANAPTITGQTLYLDSGAHMMAQERDFSITN